MYLVADEKLLLLKSLIFDQSFHAKLNAAILLWALLSALEHNHDGTENDVPKIRSKLFPK